LQDDENKDFLTFQLEHLQQNLLEDCALARLLQQEKIKTIQNKLSCYNHNASKKAL